MSAVVFVDTNILVYAQDEQAGAERERAAAALRELWNSGLGRLSVQVLQEFYVNVTRKLGSPLARSTAREIVSAYGTWIREPTTAETVLRATNLSDLARLSFWDALIVASAEQAGASQLYSEDFNAGQTIAGVTIVNPLVVK
ncbi:MAG TPA: PIN domain-containing protein [Steroidobacteraceae bacterium]|nr:PIN domain-containing protein [Steroidobacteraceae bacterium]